MKKTKVICTIGPASDSVEVMGKMVNVGMNCARINLSHATEDEILKTIDVVRKVRKISNLPVAIMYDTKGPEFRTLKFKDGGVTLKQGDTIKMSKSCIQGNENEFGVNHSDAIDFINVGDKVLIDNALFELEVVEKENDFVQLKALGDGKIENHKSINVPGVNLGLDFMSDMDRNDINFAARHSCDYLALSFVNAREDVITAREIIEKAGGDALIISKIESRRGIENIDEIIDESDGIMVARGDLGVDVPMEELPVLQKSIIKKCRQKGKFAIVATEMLASMYESPRPTRIDYSKNIDYIGSIGISDAIAKLVADAVEYADIKLIVTPTMTGFTARKISNLRPNSIILACCPSKHIAEKVVLNFGVEPVITDIYESTDEMVESAMEIAKTEFNLNKGDLLVVTGGFPIGEARRTNYLRIVEI